MKSMIYFRNPNGHLHVEYNGSVIESHLVSNTTGHDSYILVTKVNAMMLVVINSMF